MTYEEAMRDGNPVRLPGYRAGEYVQSCPDGLRRQVNGSRSYIGSVCMEDMRRDDWEEVPV